MIKHTSVLTLIFIMTSLFVTSEQLEVNLYAQFGIGDSLIVLLEKSNELLSSEEQDSMMNNAKTMMQQITNADGLSLSYKLLANVYEQIGKYDSALHFYNKAILLIEDDSIAIDCIFAKAHLLDDLNRLDSSIYYYKKGITLSNQSKDYHRQADLHYYLGGVYNYIGQNQSALHYSLLSKHYYDSTGSEENQWHVYNILGIIYEETAMYAESLEHYLVALKLAKESVEPEALMKVSNNIAVFYSLNKESQKAITHWENALELAKLNGLKKDECYVLSNMGEELLLIDDSLRSKKYIDRSVSLYDEVGDTCEIAYAFSGLGMYYTKYEMFKDAQSILSEAVLICNDCDLISVSAGLNLQLAELSIKRNNDRKAIDYLNVSISQSEVVGFIHDQRDAHKMLYEIYKRQGNDILSLYELEQYQLFKDSLLSENEQQRLAVIETELKVQEELVNLDFNLIAQSFEQKKDDLKLAQLNDS
ncbi:MAG: hypothetical protein OCD76_18375, partial [Reichenbachiella sp.]